MYYEENIINIYDSKATELPLYMRTDIKEKDGNYLLEIELPGYIREDIQAELTDGLLTIIASKPEHLESEENKSHYMRRERLVGGCKRSFFVGNEIRHEDITAAFKDGILSIIISNPEKHVDAEKRKLINIF